MTEEYDMLNIFITNEQRYEKAIREALKIISSGRIDMGREVLVKVLRDVEKSR